MEMNDWVARARDHFVAWVGEYIQDGEGKRLLVRFRDLDGDSILDALAFDLKQRLADMKEDDREVWTALFDAVGDDLQLHLAMMEPLAQSGRDLAKLISLFPEDLSDQRALSAAFESLRRGDNPLPRGFTDTKGWSDERIGQRLEEVKTHLDWENTTGSARKWWESFENENMHRRALVLRLAEELAVRKATFTEFFLACVYSNTDNLQANLSYLDYTRLKKEEEHEKQAAEAAAGQFSGDSSGEESPPAFAVLLPYGVTDTKGWSDERIGQRLEEVKTHLDWENMTGSARKWWESFENENKHRRALVLRLAEELAVRKATFTEFFLAYVYSNTDNLQANLCYLDYTRLKKEEERKKRVLAAAAKLVT